MITTTLARIRARGPCASGWTTLLHHLGKPGPDDEPLSYATILDAVGLLDAVWCLRAEPEQHAACRRMAVAFARTLQHRMTDPRSLAALDVVERHAEGLATDDELAAAWRDACAAANADAADADAAATYAANADAAAAATYAVTYAADYDDRQRLRAIFLEHVA